MGGIGVGKVMVLHGPNLNLLGAREPGIYGKVTLQEINDRLKDVGKTWGLCVDAWQSNSEGELVDFIHQAEGKYDYILINAGAYTHYSYAIHDALRAVSTPAIEIHLSNIHAREPFRRQSVLAPAVTGQISGFGYDSYELGLYAVKKRLLEEAGGPSR